MTKKVFYIIIFFSLLQFACKRTQKQHELLDSYAPKVVKAQGYVVPKDSISEPKVVPAGKPRVVRAGEPRVVLIHDNVHPADIPKVVIAGVPRVSTPGSDSFSLPKTAPAIYRSVIAGVPQVITAKEAHTGDQNPENFSSFGTLQGLKSEHIATLLEDKKGNLWFGGNVGLGKYDGKSFTYFTAKEGLSNNYVRCHLEDKNGNLWFSSFGDGVTKYDGKCFTHFTIKEGLSNNYVRCLLEDKNGNLWFGTEKGVNKYDGTSFSHFAARAGFSDCVVSSILEDKSGNLWFGTDAGIIKYDGKSFSHFTEKEGLSSPRVWSIEEDKNGNLWFANGRGASKYDGKTFTHFTKKQGLSDNSVLSILEDKNGNLWFGTESGGISKYDGKSFKHFTKTEGLNSNFIGTILEDKNGTIWFGGGGMIKYDGNSFTHLTEKEGLTHTAISCVLEDKSGNLWIGTRGGGVIKFNGKSFTQYSEEEGLISRWVWSILEDKDGNLWFGTFNGICKYEGKNFTYFTEKEGLCNNDVKFILEDKSGNLWFGATGSVSKYDGKSFTHFTDKEGLNNNFAFCLSALEDKRGNLWFGTDKGVTKYDGKSFTRFTEAKGLSSNIVQSILEDEGGNLWFGTGGGGLTRYDGKSFTRYTEKDGLSNNNVWNIIESKNGDLWFGTAFGLSQIEKDKVVSLTRDNPDDANTGLNESNIFFKTYAYEDGFSGIGANFGKTICEAKDGTIWIGAQDRLTAFHPSEKAPDTIPPNIQVTGITLFNENIPWQNLMSYPERNDGKPEVIDTSVVLANGVLLHDYHFNDVSKWYGLPEQLSLAYNNNNLTFQFVGITLQSPKKVKYQYKLEGVDENWSALTDRSEAPYNNLPHDKYTFKVKAMNGDGYWSDEVNYSFTIRPPWWQTWWFRTTAILCLLSVFYGLVRWRLYQKFRLQLERGEKEKQMSELKHKTAELEMQALRAQMNPHFIFNSLNSINMFILENNKLQASEYLSKFSRLVRLILQNSQETFIPLDRELEALTLYLELESLRFEERFEYKINVSQDVDTTTVKVPPLIIQPYAENAIWHGLMPKKEKGHLEIELYIEETILFCKITDDGIGRKRAAELKSKSSLTYKSMGMRITADRIAILRKQEQNNAFISVIDLVLPDSRPAGTEVLIKVPLSYD